MKLRTLPILTHPGTIRILRRSKELQELGNPSALAEDPVWRGPGDFRIEE